MSDTGVSIKFLLAATKALATRYGERMIGPEEPMNRFIAALAEAENAYQELQQAEWKDVR